MFKTADGHTLELAPWRMRRLMRLVAQTRRTPPGMTSRTLGQDMQILLRRARRVSADPYRKIVRFESAGACCRACFLARQKRDAMEIIALSVVPGAHVYEQETTRPGLDFESMPKSARITLAWKPYDSLENAAQQVRGKGVYILTRGGKPLYVGKSLDLAERMRTHRLYATQHGAGLRVWVANTRSPEQAAAVEHALVRTLGRGLTNAKLHGDMRVGKRGLDINCLLPRVFGRYEKAPGNRAVRSAGGIFELAP
jgi:predicted GIY-YIG superfamily endonuclease